jgi:hypothetical protein
VNAQRGPANHAGPSSIRAKTPERGRVYQRRERLAGGRPEK